MMQKTEQWTAKDAETDLNESEASASSLKMPEAIVQPLSPIRLRQSTATTTTKEVRQGLENEADESLLHEVSKIRALLEKDAVPTQLAMCNAFLGKRSLIARLAGCSSRCRQTGANTTPSGVRWTASMAMNGRMRPTPSWIRSPTSRSCSPTEARSLRPTMR